MSIHLRSPFSLDEYPLQDIAFDWELLDIGPPQNYMHDSIPSIVCATPGMTEIGHFQRPCVREPASFPWHTGKAYTALSTPTHVPNQGVQHDPTSWRPANLQMAQESFSVRFSNAVVPGMMQDADIIPASHFACVQGRHLFPQAHPAVQDAGSPGSHLLDGPSACKSPSYKTYPQDHYPNTSNELNVADSFLPRNFHYASHPTSLGLDSPFRLVPPPDSTDLSRRGRSARAIEHGGIWIDEEELLQGAKESNGRLEVHRCLWEEDRSPCDLWIKCDKSSINTHVQKWHGGKPGGEKLEVDCRWSACGKRMLKESIARHVLSIHLGETWECQACRRGNRRKDAYWRHVVKSEDEGCRIAGALITYSAEVRVIDARATLESRGRVRYADA